MIMPEVLIYARPVINEALKDMLRAMMPGIVERALHVGTNPDSVLKRSDISVRIRPADEKDVNVCDLSCRVVAHRTIERQKGKPEALRQMREELTGLLSGGEEAEKRPTCSLWLHLVDGGYVEF